MIDEKELREAYDRVSSLVVNRPYMLGWGALTDQLKLLLALAEAYLACEGFPEEIPEDEQEDYENNDLYNDVVKACRLGYTKKLEGLEEAIYCHCNTTGYNLHDVQARKELATALRTYLTNHSEEIKVKCESDGQIYTSYPPQYRCKRCLRWWPCHEPIPECTDKEE